MWIEILKFNWQPIGPGFIVSQGTQFLALLGSESVLLKFEYENNYSSCVMSNGFQQGFQESILSAKAELKFSNFQKFPWYNFFC